MASVRDSLRERATESDVSDVEDMMRSRGRVLSVSEGYFQEETRRENYGRRQSYAEC